MQQDFFSVAAMQPEVRCAKTRGDIQENLNLFASFIDSVVPYMSAVTGAPCRLVAFPESFLQGVGFGVTIQDRLKGAIQIPGEETEQLGRKAKQHNIYIVGAAYVVEPEWPDRYFNEAFLIDPQGQVILRYHKVMTAKDGEVASAPIDMYDEYVKKYGDTLDAFFPVVETELGRIGLMICSDIAFPEMARGLAMNGAEILILPSMTPEPITFEPQNIWAALNQVHAFANVCYVVAPNGGLLMNSPIPKGVLPGNSMIVDYRGRIIAQTKTNNESVIGAEINMQSLRLARRDYAMGSMLPLIQAEVFSKIYEKPMWPKNRWLDRPGTSAEFTKVRQELIQKRKDIFVPPKI
jgi:predicted amidohydrolase